jgi:hypothetical protein
LGVRTIKTRSLRAIGTALVFASAGSASAAVLDFEFDINANSLVAGQIVDNEYAPDVTISAFNPNNGSAPDVAVIFDTTDTSPAGGDFDLVGPFDSANSALPDNYDPGNVLIIHERNDCDLQSGFCETPDDEGGRPAGEFEFVFSTDIILETIDFFDIEPEEDNQSPFSEIHLFDANGVEIQAGMFFVPSTGGDNMWDQLNFGGVEGVRRIVIEMGGSGAIDNLTYQVIPAPAALWLFGSALGLLGWTRRTARRRDDF